jgi:hypothetical protein
LLCVCYRKQLRACGQSLRARIWQTHRYQAGLRPRKTPRNRHLTSLNAATLFQATTLRGLQLRRRLVGAAGAAALMVVVAAGRLAHVGDFSVLVARGGGVLEVWGVCCCSLLGWTFWGQSALAQRTVLGPGPCHAGVGVHVF